ncbi:MAG: M48 family metalloprotease [Sphingobacteriaceae bacterium]|nr:M48 family metalloprotease [Sphingobacteriaceae bacterium]
MKSIFTFLLLGCWLQAVAQTDTLYVPVLEKQPKAELVKVFEAKLKEDLQFISVRDKAIKAEVEKSYIHRTQYLTQLVQSTHLAEQEHIYGFYNSILQEILKANPSLNPNIRLLIPGYYWPNAASFGEGTITLHLGMTAVCENESQLAFVIAHELAHQYQGHVNNAIWERAELFTSEEVRQLAKNAAKEAYGAKSALLQKIAEIQFDGSRHSRRFENEADSLALKYLSFTKYDLWEALRVMDILDQVDEDYFENRGGLDLQKAFDTPAFPFKPIWLRANQTSSLLGLVGETALEKQLRDSLKTHPECAQRKTNMERQLKFIGVKPKAQEAFAQQRFNHQRYVATAEMIAALYADSNYVMAIYQSLIMLDKYPNDLFPHLVIGLSLAELQTHFAKRISGRVMPTSNPYHKASYNKLIQFLEELSKAELANLSYAYLRTHLEYTYENELYYWSMYLSSKIAGQPSEANQHKADYEWKYRKGKIKSKFTNTP